MSSSRRHSHTVLIIQETVKHYRLPFFDRLHARLLDDGIRLQVAYSLPAGRDAGKGDTVTPPDSYGVQVPAYRPFGGRLFLQPLVSAIAKADLVVVEQANRVLLNHWLFLLAGLGAKRLALWGHGRNRQSARLDQRERYKRFCLRLADWWFAYTTETADYVQACGFDRRRITTVHNAIDTRGFHALVSGVSDHEQHALRQQLGIAPDARLGLFCGSLYPGKHLPFLFESAQRIRQHQPSFELLIIGAGPDQYLVDDFSRERTWVHVLGPAFGRPKAAAFALADVCLNPGLIGLGILDAFAAGLPIFTTDLSGHGPEIEYLADNVNGRMARFDPSAYAEVVSHTLAQPLELARLSRGAEETGTRFTVDAMAENFRDGLVSCLKRADRSASSIPVNAAP